MPARVSWPDAPHLRCLSRRFPENRVIYKGMSNAVWGLWELRGSKKFGALDLREPRSCERQRSKWNHSLNYFFRLRSLGRGRDVAHATPPHRSVLATFRIRLLSWVHGVKADMRIRMKLSSRGQPVVGQGARFRAFDTAVLTPSIESAPPEIANAVTKQLVRWQSSVLRVYLAEIHDATNLNADPCARPRRPCGR